MTERDKPQPVADADSETFWAACRDGRLTAQQCDSCGRWRWPPRGVCPSCASWALHWRDLPGTGTVQAFVVPHRVFNPAFAAEAPYVVAHVALDGTDGQVVLVSNLVGMAWDAVQVGQRVEVDLSGDDRLPRFRAR